MISKLTLLLAHSLANKLDRSTPCNIFFLSTLIIVLKSFGIRLEILGYFPSISLEYNVVVPSVNII